MTEQMFTPPRNPDPHEAAAAYTLGIAIQHGWNQRSQDETTTPPPAEQTPELDT